MHSLASEAATWATELEPCTEDVDLASQSSVDTLSMDTLSVARAARRHSLRRLVDALTEPCRSASNTQCPTSSCVIGAP